METTRVPASATATKQKLLDYIKRVSENQQEILYEFEVPSSFIDKETVSAFSALFCSLDVEVTEELCAGDDAGKNKAFARKCALLNEAGLVFGFVFDAARAQELLQGVRGDSGLKSAGGSKNLSQKAPLSIKKIRALVDFMLEQYPNHIQLECDGLRPSAVLSTQDIKTVRAFFYAVETFYTYGRAVPWFLTVLEPLKIRPSVFLGDFAEWQRCNNCGVGSGAGGSFGAGSGARADSGARPGSDAAGGAHKSARAATHTGATVGFSAEDAPHTEIEKMLLNFVKLKYEEKKLPYVYPAAEDMIRLHGAFARASAEQTETVLDLSYLPDDLFSPYAQDLRLFASEVCMESCSIKVFSGREGPDFSYIN